MIPLQEIEAAARNVYTAMPPTALYAWPLLAERCGRDVWVKHENHTPTGAFKVRGGLNLLAALTANNRVPRGLISATRGNHGQSLAFACRRFGVACVIVVPHGNSADKNRALRGFGADVIEHGQDFDDAREYAGELAAARGLRLIGPFERELVAGVATYALELFRAAPALDTVYVPIGCGSGICGLISARDALGLATRIVGVVSAHANAYALSVAAGRPVATTSACTMADGMAVRVPIPAALSIIGAGAARIVEVTDDEIENAIRVCYSDTHQIAEGAGAAPLAALLQEGDAAGRAAAVILSGGNIDRDVTVRVLGAG